MTKEIMAFIYETNDVAEALKYTINWLDEQIMQSSQTEDVYKTRNTLIALEQVLFGR